MNMVWFRNSFTVHMLASLQEKTIKSLEYQKLPKEAASWLYSTVLREGRLFSKQSQANLKEKLEKHTMLLYLSGGEWVYLVWLTMAVVDCLSSDTCTMHS
jgi:hypothetical protein